MCGACYEVSPLLYQLSEVIGPLTVKVHLLACGRMDESQCLGMESLTWTEFETVLDVCLIAAAALTSKNLGTSIGCIHEERMTDMLHVGTYLMGTACLGNALHQGGVAETLQYLIMGNG